MQIVYMNVKDVREVVLHYALHLVVENVKVVEKLALIAVIIIALQIVEVLV